MLLRGTALLDDGGSIITPLGYHWLSLQPRGAKGGPYRCTFNHSCGRKLNF